MVKIAMQNQQQQQPDSQSTMKKCSSNPADLTTIFEVSSDADFDCTSLLQRTEDANGNDFLTCKNFDSADSSDYGDSQNLNFVTNNSQCGARKSFRAAILPLKETYLAKKLRRLSRQSSRSSHSSTSVFSTGSSNSSSSSNSPRSPSELGTDTIFTNGGPDITVTAPGRRSKNASVSNAGSDTSHESDHGGSRNNNDVICEEKQNASIANSRSASSENVSVRSGKSGNETTIGGQQEPKIKRERKLSGGAANATLQSNALSSQLSTANTTVATAAGPEKTRLQSAATQIKNFLAPNYKSRCEEFRKLFKTPESDKFVIDYSCAYQREILMQGRMYMSQNSLCFYANIFKWETTLTIRFKDITSISKEKTAKFIPNAIQVCTKAGEKLFFTSFSTRDKAYMMMFKIWQNSLLDQPMTPLELWNWAQHGYEEADLSGSEADHDAEDALLATLTDDEAKPGGHVANLRRLAASAPTLIPPGSNGNGENRLGACEEGELGAQAADLDLVNFLHPKPSKLSRLSTPASSPGTAITTPGEEYTESENEVEVNCNCQTHAGKEILNYVIPMSVDQLFLLLFTDSPFFQKLQNDRKTTDLTLGDWHVDKTNSTKSRKIAYTVALNHSMGPKTCSTTEQQVCTAQSRPGQLYILKCEVRNYGVPYCDTFSVDVQYCLSRVSANQCRIRVHGGVVYRKSCWGIVKSFIEKNALAGIEDYFQDLNSHLQAECARYGLTTGDSERETEKAAPGARLRRPSSKGPKTDVVSQAAVSPSAATPTGIVYPLLPSEVESVAKAILVVLILMLLLNAGLFYKLWYFESEAERATIEHSLMEFQKTFHKIDLTSTDWIRLLYQERLTHSKRSAKWAMVLESTLNRVSEVEASLRELRGQLGAIQRDFESTSKLGNFKVVDSKDEEVPLERSAKIPA